jgi:hypothetical protein
MSAINSDNYKIEIYTGANAEEESTIFRQLPKVWEGIMRFYTALEYRFHKLTYGLFEMLPSEVNRILKVLCVAGCCYIAVPFMYKNFFRSDSIFEDTSMLGFSLAPANPRSLNDEAVRTYVKHYGKIAIEEMKQFGVPASISMAQGIIESRCGESTLAKNNNNHFGIKCFKKSCKKGHCSNFTDDSHKDFFRKYPSPWESWREHSLLLSNPRFKGLKAIGNDYQRWAKGLAAYGYATDTEYAEKLIETIERYGLDELDEQ